MTQLVSDWRTGRFGRLASAWKGNKAGYVSIHTWAKRHFRQKVFCEMCGKTAREVSRLEFANVDHKYRRVEKDWIVVCPVCHNKLDIKTHCKHGHEFTPENTWVRKHVNRNDERVCRTCIARRMKIWRNRG